MKLLRFLASLTLVAGLVCMTACSDDDEEDLIIEDETTVNPDEGTGDEEEPGDTEEPKTGISFANETLETVTLDFSEGSTATLNIISYESWTGKPAFEEEEEAWFSIEPESGEASEDEQEITVTALSANAGDIRTALLYFTAEDTGEEISVTVTQASPTEGFILEQESVTLAESDQSTASVSFISYGDWTASVDDESEWLTVSNESGEGSIEQQTLTLTAGRNYGESRTATVTLTSGSSTATVTATQSATTITISEPEFTGHLSGHIASESTFVVPFSGVQTTDEISVSVNLGGVTDSLTVKDYKEVAGTTVGSAILALEGRPKTAGKLTADITVKVNDVEFLSKKMEETVYVIYMDFEKFVWGGDYVGHNAGVLPAGCAASGNVSSSDESKYDWTDTSNTTTCAYDINATGGILDFSTDFLTMFGFGKSSNDRNDAWYGTRDYMFYHQLKLANSSNYGTLETPVLTWLPQASGNSVKISVDMCRHAGDSETAYIKLSGNSGTTLKTIDTTVLPTTTSTSDSWTTSWTTVTCDATIGTSDYIRIQSAGSDVGSARLYMTNYKIELQ